MHWLVETCGADISAVDGEGVLFSEEHESCLIVLNLIVLKASRLFMLLLQADSL